MSGAGWGWDGTGTVALSDHPVRCPPLRHSDAADHGHDRVVQVLLWRRLRGRASTLLGSAHAFRLNATVPSSVAAASNRTRTTSSRLAMPGWARSTSSANWRWLLAGHTPVSVVAP